MSTVSLTQELFSLHFLCLLFRRESEEERWTTYGCEILETVELLLLVLLKESRFKRKKNKGFNQECFVFIFPYP